MSAEIIRKKRPKYLNVFILGAQLPFPGLVSIFHRVTGAGLFVLFWLVIWLFDKSLASPEDYAEVVSWLHHPIVLIIGLALLWAFIFHFYAGIRYLLLDCNIGYHLKAARFSSFMVAIACWGTFIVVAAFIIWEMWPLW